MTTNNDNPKDRNPAAAADSRSSNGQEIDPSNRPERGIVRTQTITIQYDSIEQTGMQMAPAWVEPPAPSQSAPRNQGFVEKYCGCCVGGRHATR